VTLTLSSKLH